MYFYDTSSLLAEQNIDKITEPFVISSITYAELEHIKTSKNKDENVKYKARKVVNFLKSNPSKRLVVYPYEEDFQKFRKRNPFMPDNNDARIIYSAHYYQTESGIDLVFLTEDGLCQEMAKLLSLKVGEVDKTNRSYKGYSLITAKDENELSSIYDRIFKKPESFDLVENQYLLIKYEGKVLDDCYKMKQGLLQKVIYPEFRSSQLGKIKPKEPYQLCLMDSMQSNQITIAGGVAGAGKSYLSLGYLFQELEQNHIDKIVIFCNTVAVKDAARLGFYPGDKIDKLLDSQIGNFLTSKLGSRTEVERMIDEEKIILIPLADARGYDTSGMNAGIYVQEAQNLSVEHMKLLLQRVGKDCVCILDGDCLSQVDMDSYFGDNNGLKKVSEVFKGEDIFGQIDLPITHRSKIAQIAERMKEDI